LISSKSTALQGDSAFAVRLDVAKLNLMLSSDRSQIGTGSSNSPRSATESRLCGFSARSGGIARACGFICVMRSSGETTFRRFVRKTRPKFSVGK
jgi:hypothetical protein